MRDVSDNQRLTDFADDIALMGESEELQNLERLMLKANVYATCRLDPATVGLDDVGLCGGMGADLCSTLGTTKGAACAASALRIKLI